MQQLHVRNIFKLLLPFEGEVPPRVDLSSSPSNFGFTVISRNNEPQCSYRIHMYTETRRNQHKNETESTELLQWG